MKKLIWTTAHGEQRTTLHPEIGYYYSYCCIEDTMPINTQEELNDILEDFEEGENPPCIFPTIEAAVNWPDESPETRQKHYQRLLSTN